METIHIRASKAYDVHIGAGLLDRICALVPAKPCRAVIVTDEHVAPLYLGRLREALDAGGYKTDVFITACGEEAKSFFWYEKLVSFLAGKRLTRTDMLFALGGGVVGDLTGFAAATYLRGVPFVQVPTTLLAAVDSSVGGKTAINLPKGKNLLGAFNQPCAVIMDTDTVKTLDRDTFTDGCGEIIKHTVLADDALFALLSEKPLPENREDGALLEKIIARNVAIKQSVVERDERDTGIRNLLNLGHTFGHAIEACSGFTVKHGHAVAAGMAIVSRIAARQGICADDVPQRIEAILRAYGLPTDTQYPFEDLLAALRMDKKFSGSTLRLVLPEKIGKCRIEAIEENRLDKYLLG